MSSQKNAVVKAKPNEWETSSDKESENKNVHENSTPNEGGFNNIRSNSEKFDSIININKYSNENQKSTKDLKVRTIAGVNLNQNFFF